MQPLYRLIDVERGVNLVDAIDVEGFFVDPSQEPPREVTLSSAVLREGAGATLDDVELQVLDSRGRPIGGYHIGQVRISDHGLSSAPTRSLFLDIGGYCQPFPSAGAIWRRWSTGAPTKLGEWCNYRLNERRSWLHVVQEAWFFQGKRAARYDDRLRYELDGEQILNMDSFYCALGEAINGPGGYFGSNLDALEDCLRSSSSDNPFDIVWRRWEPSVEALGGEAVQQVLSVLREYGVQVVESE